MKWPPGFLLRLLCIILAGALLLAIVFCSNALMPQCASLQLFDLPCAGCYGSRALDELLHGHFIRSLSLNLFPVLLLLLGALWIFLPNILYRLFRHPFRLLTCLLLLIALQWGLNIFHYQHEASLVSISLGS